MFGSSGPRKGPLWVLGGLAKERWWVWEQWSQEGWETPPVVTGLLPSGDWSPPPRRATAPLAINSTVM